MAASPNLESAGLPAAADSCSSALNPGTEWCAQLKRSLPGNLCIRHALSAFYCTHVRNKTKVLERTRMFTVLLRRRISQAAEQVKRQSYLSDKHSVQCPAPQAEARMAGRHHCLGTYCQHSGRLAHRVLELKELHLKSYSMSHRPPCGYTFGQGHRGPRGAQQERCPPAQGMAQRPGPRLLYASGCALEAQQVCSHAASLHFAGSGLPAGEPSWERCTVWSMREATNTRIILALTSTMSSQSRKMLQPSLRAVLITYLAFPSRSWADAPGVTTARLMHLGSTADSRSTCKMHHR